MISTARSQQLQGCAAASFHGQSPNLCRMPLPGAHELVRHVHSRPSAQMLFTLLVLSQTGLPCTETLCMLPKLRMLLQCSLISAQQAICKGALYSCSLSAGPHSHAQEPSSSLQEAGTSSSGHSHTLQSRSMHMLSSGQKGQSHQRLTCRVGNRLEDVPGVLINRG